MTILGIDPGSTSMGYAVLSQEGSKLAVVAYGTTKIKEKELLGKLTMIRNFVRELIETYEPGNVGIEKLFFSTNKKTAFEVAEARGVILITLIENGAKIIEVTPGEVKVAVTNYGASDKEMVKKMVIRLLNIKDFKGDDNASDALAIAIATANSSRIPSSSK
jgi:crossover junction endodeoxyribonuclease RuvC